MQITTDTTVIYALIQAELDKRYEVMKNSAQNLPFSNIPIIKLNDIGTFLYKDFAQNVITELKK